MTDNITTLQKSLLMIQKLKKLLKEQQDKHFFPIAIIGLNCRLPQAHNHETFWQSLCQGNNMITRMPDERWSLLKETNEPAARDQNLNYWGGYLPKIEAFDAYFFGISPREALRMDPQQRQLLEVSYEAFEDAGLTVDSLAGANMGVFSSLYASQFSHIQTLDADMDALFLSTGSAISMAANRLSYIFDLRGPSMTLDTACSSSLIAIQMACLSLQAKLCEKALVNAVNINLLPSLHSVLSKATMLSKTGQCHTFDASADGYVQGEGVGAIVLKPLAQALKDQDRIYAVIAGGALNQDGKTNGLTAPNGAQQEQLLRAAYQVAKIDPALVSYIECHGTGTFLGDPIEIEALGEVIGKGRDQSMPCWISSVKTNIGHLEPAAGILSIIKAALALKHGIIPPHQNFTTPNPHIRFNQYVLKIPLKPEQYPKYGECRVAGVSGFGFGGANAHIVLRELSAQEQSTPSITSSKNNEIFTLSAKDEAALTALIGLWCHYLKENRSRSLAQICYNLHLRRSHFPYRLAIVAHDIDDLTQKLSARYVNQYLVNDDVFSNPEMRKSVQPVVIKDVEQMDDRIIASHYVNNVRIDWAIYEEHRSYENITMPFYPWQHKDYWPSMGKTAPDVINTTYPLRGQLVSSPLSSHQFEFTFDTKVMPEIQDTFHVLHAGFYVEMLAFAIEQLHQTNTFTTDNLTFVSPLLVPHQRTVRVQLVLNKEENESSYAFHLYSFDGKNNWVEHAHGQTSVLTMEPQTFSANLIFKNDVTGTADMFYNRIINMGMPAGDTIKWIDQYWLRDDEIFCQLRAPKSTERGEAFVMKMHLGIVDACIQTLFLLLPPEFNKPFVASHLKRIEFFGKPTDKLFIYAKLKHLHPEGKTIMGDWYLLDKNHEVIAKCEDIVMAQLSNFMQIDQMVNMEFQSDFQLDFTLPQKESQQQLIHYLTEQFALLFSMPKSDLDIHQSLHHFGLDSLMAIAVIKMIESNLNVTFALPELMKGPSISDLAQHILNRHIPSPSKNEVVVTNKTSDNPWIANRIIQPNAQLRLFCLPFGGGGASIYREWQQDFPDYIEVCPIQLPGRENRLEEAPIENIETLVQLLATALKPLLNMPYAFFGHSFGSLIAFELTRYLRRHQLNEPTHLFVSAYPDPRLPSRSLTNLVLQLEQTDLHLFNLDQRGIDQLSDEQLSILSTIFKNNGFMDYSDERMSKSIIQVLLPIFISDMNIIKNYTYALDTPLNIRLTIFLGAQDTWVLPEEHKGWPFHTSQRCQFLPFDSGHLFIREKEVRIKVIQKITHELEGFHPATRNIFREENIAEVMD